MTPPPGAWAIDPWNHVRALTPARVALGRSGVSLPTHQVLALSLAHARARDAVHRPLDVAALQAALPDARVVSSAAPDRATYLRRPDLGRRPAGLPELGAGEVAVVLADGLSPAAVEASGPAVVAALATLFGAAGFVMAPPVLATQARVALGDHIAAAIGARAVVVLIGERPGLSVPASLGAYVTWAPVAGVTTDADRNCVSNIQPDGLSPAEAARRIAWLLAAARAAGRSGRRVEGRQRGGHVARSGWSGTTGMNRHRYEDDVTLWAEEQTALLRARELQGLDLDNLAEEIEAVGASQRREVRSRLAVLVQHLLKYRFQPLERSQSWSLTIRTQRDELEAVLQDSPSLRRLLPEMMAQAHRHGRARALEETGLLSLPTECPFSVTQILDHDWLPD